MVVRVEFFHVQIIEKGFSFLHCGSKILSLHQQSYHRFTHKATDDFWFLTSKTKEESRPWRGQTISSIIRARKQAVSSIKGGEKKVAESDMDSRFSSSEDSGKQKSDALQTEKRARVLKRNLARSDAGWLAGSIDLFYRRQKKAVIGLQWRRVNRSDIVDEIPTSAAEAWRRRSP